MRLLSFLQPAARSLQPALFGIGLLLVCSALAAPLLARADPDWIRFRGPNGSGISSAKSVPTQFGLERPGASAAKNLVWKLPLPPGHSSPILWKDRIYLTAYRGDVLSTIAIDRL